MAYRIDLKASVEKELKQLPAKVYHRIVQQILLLEIDPRPSGCKKLRGVERYRIRIGDYRVLFTVDDSLKVIEVVSVKHRKDAYKEL